MTESILTQVLPYESFATAFIEGKFGHRAVSPARVVGDVLAGFIGKPPRLISNPKRFLLRACRLRALQVCRGRNTGGNDRPTLEGILQRRRDEASEILIALEDQDRSKFFGKNDPSCEEPVESPKIDQSIVELSATLQFPITSVRMQIQFSGRQLSGGAA